MKIPTIHLNGSAPSVLLDQLAHATEALRRAALVLHDTAPNARDYYVQDDRAYHEAEREHSDRVRRVMSVLGELHVIAEQIQAQVDTRVTKILAEDPQLSLTGRKP